MTLPVRPDYDYWRRRALAAERRAESAEAERDEARREKAAVVAAQAQPQNICDRLRAAQSAVEDAGELLQKYYLNVPPGGEPTQAAAAQLLAERIERNGELHSNWQFLDWQKAELALIVQALRAYNPTALTRARDEGRAEGMEIAARECELFAEAVIGEYAAAAELRACADAIRARKGQPTPTTGD